MNPENESQPTQSAAPLSEPAESTANSAEPTAKPAESATNASELTVGSAGSNLNSANSEHNFAPGDAEAQMRHLSRRSFLWAGVAGIGTLAGYKWINSRRLDDGIPWPLRRVLDAQGEVARDLFSKTRLAPTFPPARAREPRVNGDIGMSEDFDLAAWTLDVSGLQSGEDLQLNLAQIKKLPRTQITTELKCIEGWATVVTWAGVKFSDFLHRYPPATRSGEAPDLTRKPEDLLPYVSAQTPDGAYFVGLDIESVLHPQTLLCYEMNGQPLSLEHGAPLRLVTPTKYGIKHLKRLGTLEFTARKPEDYWAQRGYDWYSGH